MYRFSHLTWGQELPEGMDDLNVEQQLGARDVLVNHPPRLILARLHGQHGHGARLGPVHRAVKHRDPAAEVHPARHDDGPRGSVHARALDPVHAVVHPVEAVGVVVDGEGEGAGEEGYVDVHSVGHAGDVDSLDPVALSVCPVEPSVTV